MRHGWMAVMAAVLVSSAAWAGDPEDMEGAKDHPDIARFPGFYIQDQTAHDFNAVDFAVKKNADDEEVTKHLEGRYLTTTYGLKDGARQPSSTELVRNFENAVKKKGGKLVYNGVDKVSGNATYELPLGKSERWISLHVDNEGANYTLALVDVGAMEQKLEMSASEMKAALDKNGFVALYGIEFDTGKDSIKPASEPLLAEIVSLLNSDPSLALSVEGHTDNVGNKKANEALSKKRAASVKKYLVAHGVADKRLTTAGYGDSKPAADNRTEEGRAKNRRVELVKK